MRTDCGLLDTVGCMFYCTQSRACALTVVCWTHPGACTALHTGRRMRTALDTARRMRTDCGLLDTVRRMRTALYTARCMRIDCGLLDTVRRMRIALGTARRMRNDCGYCTQSGACTLHTVGHMRTAVDTARRMRTLWSTKYSEVTHAHCAQLHQSQAHLRCTDPIACPQEPCATGLRIECPLRSTAPRPSLLISRLLMVRRLPLLVVSLLYRWCGRTRSWRFSPAAARTPPATFKPTSPAGTALRRCTLR